uniref:Uncharacterized protein n=1 Tax=Arundo donax TaxID=35708 RepID=A0A0A9GV64_ARUDO
MDRAVSKSGRCLFCWRLISCIALSNGVLCSDLRDHFLWNLDRLLFWRP